jgi:large subunit ribosomal protein L29
MKIEDIRALGDGEIIAQLDEAREELMNLRFQQATGELLDTSVVGKTRRRIARYETVLRERELNTAEGEA